MINIHVREITSLNQNAKTLEVRRLIYGYFYQKEFYEMTGSIVLFLPSPPFVPLDFTNKIFNKMDGSQIQKEILCSK